MELHFLESNAVGRHTPADDDVEEAIREVGQVVEGVHTAPALRDLAHRLGLELPITEAVCAVLEGASIHDLVSGLMGRRPKEE